MTARKSSTTSTTRTRKAKTAAPVDERRDAFMLTTTQAQAARIVGMDGKAFRQMNRNAGLYVSRDGTWDAASKTAAYDRVIAREARKATPSAEPTPSA